ncbi:MAG: MBL fold metallo-hydrolase [Desulfobacterales bacterium]|nr:MBL fold metallo-hydrolase [Desulfobacterales bacterium]
MQSPAMYKHCPLELTANIWLVGNYYFNLYLIKGTHACALVEMGVSAVVDAVIGQIDSLGVSPDYLVLAHPHTDHITGMPGLMERYPKARLVAAEGARDFALHPKALPGMVYEDQYIATRLGQVGLPAGRPALQALSFPEDHRVIDQPVDIDLGGLTLRCLPVPSHSPGNLAVHVPERNTLFVSDSLGFHYPGRGFCPLFFTGFGVFQATLAELEALKPEIVGPGHQGALAGPDAETVFRQAREAADGVLATVRASNESDAAIAERLFEKYYVDEFTLYSEENIMGCCRLLVRRAKEALLVATVP